MLLLLLLMSLSLLLTVSPKWANKMLSKYVRHLWVAVVVSRLLNWLLALLLVEFEEEDVDKAVSVPVAAAAAAAAAADPQCHKSVVP